MIILPKIDKFFTFFPSFFFLNLVVANWQLLLSPNIFFTHFYIFFTHSLTGTKLGVFAHPCKCKLLLKLRLDVVLGDLCAPLSVLTNTCMLILLMLISKSLKSSSTYLARSQLKDLKYRYVQMRCIFVWMLFLI